MKSMTNGEKYTTAQERAEAFDKFCDRNEICCECRLSDEHDRSINACRFAWLDLEAEEEKPLPCPFCCCKCRCENYGDINSVKRKSVCLCHYQ